MRAQTLALLAIAMPVALPVTLSAAQAAAGPACDVPGARIEEAIAAQGALREGANAQAVRDLRTLRDAAIVLDTYKFGGECEVLLGIAKSLLADPAGAIGQGGDTDEDRAEGLVAAREPKGPAAAAAGKAPAAGE